MVPALRLGVTKPGLPPAIYKHVLFIIIIILIIVICFCVYVCVAVFMCESVCARATMAQWRLMALMARTLKALNPNR